MLASFNWKARARRTRERSPKEFPMGGFSLMHWIYPRVHPPAAVRRQPLLDDDGGRRQGHEELQEGMADERTRSASAMRAAPRRAAAQLPRDQDRRSTSTAAPREPIRAAAAAARRRSPLSIQGAAPCSASIPPSSSIVAVLALIFIGPKDLPKVMRTVGYWVGRVRGMARHFTSGIENDDARGRARGDGEEMARGE